MIAPKVRKPTRAEAAESRNKVKKRSRGTCEGCGKRPATDMHHRQFKSRGGLDTVVNLFHLCGGDNGLPGGNHSGCHGEAHDGVDAEVNGWAVASWDDPADKPVLYRGRWVLLLPDGGLEEQGVPF